MKRFAMTLFALAVGLGLVVGCSSKPGAGAREPNRSDELQDVANMLREFASAKNRGPANAGELAAYESTFVFGYKPVKSGDVIIVWGATMGGEGGGGSEGVIAYEKKAPTEGGWVLLANGQVKEMSASQFTAAPKATK